MKMFYKLDMLQDMACENFSDPCMLYLIGLLAEHAEDEEMTEQFLLWVKKELYNMAAAA